MNKVFLKQLTKLSDVDFVTLEHHLHVARQVRNLYNREGLSVEELCEHLDINPNRFNEVIVGAYPFDLKFLSKLQVLFEKYIVKKLSNRLIAKGYSSISTGILKLLNPNLCNEKADIIG